MIKEQLNVLINLAASDRTVGEKEAKVIHLIGKANGLSNKMDYFSFLFTNGS
mgnify:CR=1 FL=1